MTLGEMIRNRREATGLSQQEMAEKLFVSRQTVSRWESGSRTPDVFTVKKIAGILGVTMDELIPGEEDLEAVPVKNVTPPEKRMQCALFLGILSIWALVWATVSGGTFMAVASMVAMGAAVLQFVFGYFPE